MQANIDKKANIYEINKARTDIGNLITNFRDNFLCVFRGFKGEEVCTVKGDRECAHLRQW